MFAAAAAVWSMTADGEDLRSGKHGVFERAGDVGHRREQQIAERVALERRVAFEAVVEDLGEELLVIRERDDAVADVAWRRDAEFAPQLAGGTAFVGDGDDRGEARD